jgi:7-cyano-7-deazaguanine synthase
MNSEAPTTIEQAVEKRNPKKQGAGRKAIVIMSGGMDSTTALYWAKQQGFEVETLTVDYGQQHRKEIVQAGIISGMAHVPNILIDATGINRVMKGSALTGGGKVPHGHYAESNMKATVVPNRNMILLSLATARAVQTGADTIIYGPHAGDHDIYPDCRKEFVDAMAEAMALCDYKPIALVTPFVKMTKADIVGLGVRLGVPYGETWTCYEGGRIHCGRCGTCVERREAFETAGIEDPVEFKDRNAWAMIVHAAEKAKELRKGK